MSWITVQGANISYRCVCCARLRMVHKHGKQNKRVLFRYFTLLPNLPVLKPRRDGPVVKVPDSGLQVIITLLCFACSVLLCFAFALLCFTLLYFTLLYFTLKSNLISPHQELYFQIKALIMQTEDYGRHEGNEPGRILLRPGFTYYSDVIMSVLASQISGVSIVYWTVWSGADQRKHQSPTSRPLWGEFTGDRWIPGTNGQ